MLHVTNGASAEMGIRAAGFSGDVLCWNDVLHEGPVPLAAPEELRKIRAQFLGSSWTTAQKALEELTARDARLQRWREEDEVVLWFEHDLYDQLQLLQILDALGPPAANTGRITLICGAEYVGPSSPQRLQERFPDRTAVTRAQVDLARTAWTAFRAPDPSPVLALLREDLSALPFLAAALTRHLQQYPSTFNGLSRSEQAALETMASGITSVRDIYIASHQQREDPIFLGDTVVFDYLQQLSVGTTRLVDLRNPSAVMDAECVLTELGRAVLAGTADRVRTCGIDRWFGGVHVAGHEAAWRWHGESLIPNR